MNLLNIEDVKWVEDDINSVKKISEQLHSKEENNEQSIQKTEEIKRTDEDISATKIITNIDDEKYFKENTPKEIHSLYKELVKVYS